MTTDKVVGHVNAAFTAFNERPRGEHISGTNAESILYSGLENMVTLRELFKSRNVQFTFFPVGSWLENAAETAGDEYVRGVFGDFPVGNHTYTHCVFKSVAGRAPVHNDEIAGEISRANDVIEDILGRKPTGFTSPCGMVNGLAKYDETDMAILNALEELGFEWCSTDCRVEGNSLYMPLFGDMDRIRQPFAYETGKGIIEIPHHGWQDVANKHVHETEKPSDAPMSDAAIIESFRNLYKLAGETSQEFGKAIYLVLDAHTDFMHGPATKKGGYTDKSLSLWRNILDKTLEMGVDIVGIEDIYESVK